MRLAELPTRLWLVGETYPDQVIFAKGHGTQNDFVLLPDVSAQLELSPAAVAALCDRRRGLGADGVLRVTTAGALVAAGVLARLPDGVESDDWYMDYRNADGSVAQMCGNGVRVFSHYLRASGLESQNEFTVGSLAGPRPVIVHHVDDLIADVTVEMGKANVLGTGWAVVGGRRMTGLGVDVGNPHLACLDADLSEEGLAALDVAAPVQFDAQQFPEGVNVEILTAPRFGGSRTGARGSAPANGAPANGVPANGAPANGAPANGAPANGAPANGAPANGAVSMRVHERGVGETRSCGTGTVAAACAALAHLGETTGSLQVRIPGGEVAVVITDTTSYLRGPSVLLARGELSDDWWANQL